MEDIIRPEVLIGLLALMGIIVGTLNRLSLLEFRWKPNKKEAESEKPEACPVLAECPDPVCQNNVTRIAEDLSRLKDSVDKELWPRVDEIGNNVSYIRGWIDKNGGH